jgi:prepilin-type N-terminal cleavage/methylation domain-containing protein
MARTGFTLLELVLVIVVLLVLAGLTFGLLQVVENGKVTLTEGRIRALRFEAKKLAGLKGFPPAALEDLAPALEQPGWMSNGRFVDAWDRPLEYRVEGKRFRLWSCGPDGISGTADDLDCLKTDGATK